jgi:hypothetical protein
VRLTMSSAARAFVFGIRELSLVLL